MISKFKERITISLLKTNIGVVEFESDCNNQTKSEFIDNLITNYANDYRFKRVVEINIIKSLKNLGFICEYDLNSKIDYDKITITTSGYYDSDPCNMISIIAESTFDFNIKILRSIKRILN